MGGAGKCEGRSGDGDAGGGSSIAESGGLDSRFRGNDDRIGNDERIGYDDRIGNDDRG